MTFHVSSSSGRSQSMSTTTSRVPRSCQPCGPGARSLAMGVCSTTSSWQLSGEPWSLRQPVTSWHRQLGGKPQQHVSTFCGWEVQGLDQWAYPCARRTPRSHPTAGSFGTRAQWASLPLLEPLVSVWPSSMPTNWIYSCWRTWDLVGRSPKSSAGWMTQILEALTADPVSTWYQSFYDDYMAYIKVAERDAVLAADCFTRRSSDSRVHCHCPWGGWVRSTVQQPHSSGLPWE